MIASHDRDILHLAVARPLASRRPSISEHHLHELPEELNWPDGEEETVSRVGHQWDQASVP